MSRFIYSFKYLFTYLSIISLSSFLFNRFIYLFICWLFSIFYFASFQILSVFRQQPRCSFTIFEQMKFKSNRNTIIRHTETEFDRFRHSNYFHLTRLTSMLCIPSATSKLNERCYVGLFKKISKARRYERSFIIGATAAVQ